MDDLISRQAAIDALNELKIYRPLDSDRWVISDCLNKIVNLPSAERRGRWEELYKNNYKCSVCGSWWTCEGSPIERGFDYCPTCGSRMDLEGDIE